MKKLILAMFLLSLAASAQAIDWEKKNLDFSISGGILCPGEIQGSYYSSFDDADTLTFRSQPLFLMRGIVDYFFIPNLGISGNINYASIAMEKDIDFGHWDGRDHIVPKGSIPMLEFNSGLKARFFITDQFAFKPALYFGFRKTFSSNPDASEMGIALNGSAEFQYYFNETFNIFWDWGFLSQPYGGIEGVAYIRASPILYFNIGFGI
jgi:hypothetical protein